VEKQTLNRRKNFDGEEETFQHKKKTRRRKLMTKGKNGETLPDEGMGP